MNRTIRAIRRRLLQALPTILGIALLNFLILNLAPGDLVDAMGAEQQITDPDVLSRLRETYGLDRSLGEQLVSYLTDLARLDLGYSYRHGEPVSQVILERLPATLILMFSSLGVALFLGVTLGVIASLRVNTLTDNLISVGAVLFFAAPSFWVGLMMMVAFAVKLGWLPVAGMQTIGKDYSVFETAIDVLRHLAMPAMALGLFYAAVYARVMRTSMLEIFGLDFVRTARAKGLPERVVAFKHVLRNALLPVVTLLSLQLGTVLAGSVVIESVFSWPGIGTLIVGAVSGRNFPVVAGVLFLASIMVIASNLIVDLLYMVLDPRVELR
jgi:peptide/nickel transport system permease protein